MWVSMGSNSFSCMVFNLFKIFNIVPQQKIFPEILFLVAKFCVRMTSLVKTNEISPFQCWKEIYSKLNKFKLIHWNVDRFPNCGNLKVNIVGYLHNDCFSKSIQLLASDWFAQLFEVTLTTYTMNSVFLPLSLSVYMWSV